MQNARHAKPSATDAPPRLVGLGVRLHGERRPVRKQRSGYCRCPRAAYFPFDPACTPACDELMGKARAAGLAVATTDGYIAAIAAANGLAVATRYTGAFKAAGAAVIDPWQA